MERGFSFKNLLSNTTKRQKIGFGVAVVIIIILIIVLLLSIAEMNRDDNYGSSNEGEQSEVNINRETYTDDSGEEVTVITRTDGDGDVSKSEIKKNSNGESVLVEEQVDEFGNSVRVERILKNGEIEEEVINNGISVNTEYNGSHRYTLDEYLPRIKYDYLANEKDVSFKYEISENSAVEKGIVVTVNGCSERVNIESANEYLREIPLDLTEYEIIYRIRACNTT